MKPIDFRGSILIAAAAASLLLSASTAQAADKVRFLIDWAFQVRGLYRVEWHCRTDNLASSNVARRLGLQHEATLRSSYPWKGVRHDTEIWAVLAEDWK